MSTNENIVDGGPAFPVKDFPHESGGQLYAQGLTIRDWFAGQQLARIGIGWPNDENMRKLAANCYAMADAMLRERAKARGEQP